MAETQTYGGFEWTREGPGQPWKRGRQVGAQAKAPAPDYDLQRPKTAAEVTKTQVDTTGQVLDNRVTEATLPATVKKTNADAVTAERTSSTAGLPEGFMWTPDGKNAVPIPGYTRQGLSPEVRSQAIQAYNDAAAIDETVATLRQKYEETIGKTTGVRGLGDFFPSADKDIFNDTGQRARGYVKRSLGFTGGEGNTLGEQEALYGPYLPSTWDRDERALAKIEALEELGRKAREKSIALLGGVPDANGNIRPVQEQPLPNAMTMTRTVGGDPLQAAAFGATTGVDQYPPEMLQAHEALVGRLLLQGGGKLDPQAYAAERAKLNQQFEFAGDQQSDLAWANRINEYLASGGKTVPTDIQPPERELSNAEWIRNSAVNNPIGAAVVGAADMGGMGGVSLIDNLTGGGRMDALRDSQSLPMLLGEIGGSIYGAKGIGKIGEFATGKILPSSAATRALTGGGRKGNLGREMTADAAYSGIVGTNRGEDTLDSTVFGAGGSLLGRGVGKTLGTAAEGVKISPAAQYLRDRNIPITVGQALGGFGKSLEDAATSVPIVGDMIGRRYKDSLRGLSTAAAEDVGGSIGYKPTPGKFGRELSEEMGQEISDYYTNATQGANVPLDGQYAQDFADVAALGQKLPDDLRGKFGLALNNRVNPINDAGHMTGETYQQAMRGLKGYKGEHVKPGFEGDYRDALSGAQDALKSQMKRGGGAAVADGIDNADQAYRLYKTLDNAIMRADGAEYLPTASQIQDAVKATGKKFPGKNPLLDLADQAQEVLPSKLPDSGTPRRMIQSALGAAAIGGGAAGADAYFGTDIVNPYTIGALALLTGGGTAKGQKALVKAMVDRPQALKTTGTWINTRRGLLGRAAIPWVLPNEE